MATKRERSHSHIAIVSDRKSDEAIISSSPLGNHMDPLLTTKIQNNIFLPGMESSNEQPSRRTPQTINTGLSNRHKNRLFQPPREILPSVSLFQNDLSKIPPSQSKMIQDAITYYMKNKRIKIISKYELYHTIGSGSFSKVKFAISTSDLNHPKPIACKIISIDSMNEQDMQVYVMREISILKRLNHKNVVKFADVVKSENNIYLFVELISGGDLQSRVKNSGKLSESTAKKYFVQLWEGLQYCHQEEKIAHRDLKPQNILVDETPEGDILKISDFGLAALVNDNKKKFQSQVGTVYYMSPEVRLGKTYDGFSADIYSCGMILFSMLSGDPLRLTDQQIKTAYNDKELIIDFPPYFSPEVKHLLSLMLNPDPNSRIQLSDIPYHPWCVEEFRQLKIKKSINESPPHETENIDHSNHSNHTNHSNPNSESSSDSQTPTLTKKKSFKGGLLLINRNVEEKKLRQRSNSQDGMVTNPIEHGRRRSLSLSRISENFIKKTPSSPLVSGDKLESDIIVASTSKQDSTGKMLEANFIIRIRKMPEAVSLVQAALQRMKCIIRELSPNELYVEQRYVDNNEKKATLKYSIHFSIQKHEGFQCTKADFKHLSGENQPFKKSFSKLKKELNYFSNGI